MKLKSEKQLSLRIVLLIFNLIFFTFGFISNLIRFFSDFQFYNNAFYHLLYSLGFLIAAIILWLLLYVLDHKIFIIIVSIPLAILIISFSIFIFNAANEPLGDSRHQYCISGTISADRDIGNDTIIVEIKKIGDIIFDSKSSYNYGEMDTTGEPINYKTKINILRRFSGDGEWEIRPPIDLVVDNKYTIYGDFFGDSHIDYDWIKNNIREFPVKIYNKDQLICDTLLINKDVKFMQEYHLMKIQFPDIKIKINK